MTLPVTLSGGIIAEPTREPSHKKLYETPEDFILDEYKKGKTTMKEVQLEMDLGPEDTKIRTALRKKRESLEEYISENSNPIDHDLDNQEIVIRRRHIKTLKKNVNNFHKSVRNIKRVLEELL